MKVMKRYLCSICKKRLTQESFYPDKYRSTGTSSRCISCHVDWAKTRKKLDRRKYFENYRKQNAKIISAKDKVRYALKTGKLKKNPCIKCGKKSEAHHLDYNKPLEVIWLCHKHHMGKHIKNSWRVGESRVFRSYSEGRESPLSHKRE